MSDRHSNSDCENILSADYIEKNLFSTKEHFDPLNWISKLIDKLFIYLSFLEGLIIVVGLIYLFIKWLN